jgi:hypothetical protein
MVSRVKSKQTWHFECLPIIVAVPPILPNSARQTRNGRGSRCTATLTPLAAQDTHMHQLSSSQRRALIVHYSTVQYSTVHIPELNTDWSKEQHRSNIVEECGEDDIKTADQH